MKRRILGHALVIVPATLFLWGCYESNESTADIPDGETGVETIDHEIVPDPPAEPDIDADDTDVCTPQNTCYVDFPCRFMSICIDESTLQECRDISCLEACGTSCCSGGTCGEVSGGTEECPAGTACLEKVEGSYFHSGQAACLPPPSDASTASDVDYDVWHRPEAYQTWCH